MTANAAPPTPAGPNARRVLSPAGLRFLEAHEGYRAQLYDAGDGCTTIGYGHCVHRGKPGTNPAAEAPFRGGLARAPAAILLAKDAARFEAAVRTWVTRPLQQHEFDALVAFAFNVGVGAFSTSTLVRRVNTNATPDAIVSAFLMWVKAAGKIMPGLRKRRSDEAILFLEGRYGGPAP